MQPGTRLGPYEVVALRGAGGMGDKGALSTFIKITVGNGDARYEYYRADAQGLNYKVVLSGSLLKD